MRCVSRDPIGENGWINLYGYVENNPLIYFDPFGLSLGSALASFGYGLAIGAAGTYVMGVAVISGTVLGAGIAVGLAAYGGFSLGKALYELYTETDYWTGRQLCKDEQVDIAAGLAGSILGGGFAVEGFAGGREITGNGWRAAPFGNRTGNQFGENPHYHRAVPNPKKPGNSMPGQGIGRHRPWETKSSDTSFWDRF